MKKLSLLISILAVVLSSSLASAEVIPKDWIAPIVQSIVANPSNSFAKENAVLVNNVDIKVTNPKMEWIPFELLHEIGHDNWRVRFALRESTGASVNADCYLGIDPDKKPSVSAQLYQCSFEDSDGNEVFFRPIGEVCSRGKEGLHECSPAYANGSFALLPQQDESNKVSLLRK